MMLLLLASLTGGLGAAARFVVDGEIRLRWRGALPLSTFVINVAGSLILGFTVGLAGPVTTPDIAAHAPAQLAGAVALAFVGFCGGFTTFSTAMFEVVQLFYQRRPWLALLYLLGSMLAAVGAVVVGLLVTSP